MKTFTVGVCITNVTIYLRISQFVVLLLLLKFNQTEIQITKYYVGHKVMVVVYNPNKIKLHMNKNDHSLNVIFIYSYL